jgi:hypothetical protein
MAQVYTNYAGWLILQLWSMWAWPICLSYMVQVYINYTGCLIPNYDLCGPQQSVCHTWPKHIQCILLTNPPNHYPHGPDQSTCHRWSKSIQIILVPQLWSMWAWPVCLSHIAQVYTSWQIPQSCPTWPWSVNPVTDGPNLYNLYLLTNFPIMPYLCQVAKIYVSYIMLKYITFL